MHESFKELLAGYQVFRQRYGEGDAALMKKLAEHGQKPEVMVIGCSDSRVDPATVLQCNPGDIFTVRNVANIIPPAEADNGHHGTSAALEYAVCYLNVKHIVIMAHSQCGGIQALFSDDPLPQDDYISDWVSLMKAAKQEGTTRTSDDLAKKALLFSYQNALSFPWIKARVDSGQLHLHLWYFDIHKAELLHYEHDKAVFTPV